MQSGPWYFADGCNYVLLLKCSIWWPHTWNLSNVSGKAWKKRIFHGQADRKRLPSTSPPPPPPLNLVSLLWTFFVCFFILEYVIICEADFTQEKSHFHPTSSIPNSFWRPPLRCEIPEFAILPLKTHKFCWEYLSILALLQSYYYKCWGCSAVYIFGKNWRK